MTSRPTRWSTTGAGKRCASRCACKVPCCHRLPSDFRSPPCCTGLPSAGPEAGQGGAAAHDVRGVGRRAQVPTHHVCCRTDGIIHRGSRRQRRSWQRDSSARHSRSACCYNHRPSTGCGYARPACARQHAVGRRDEGRGCPSRCVCIRLGEPTATTCAWPPPLCSRLSHQPRSWLLAGGVAAVKASHVHKVTPWPGCDAPVALLPSHSVGDVRMAGKATSPHPPTTAAACVHGCVGAAAACAACTHEALAGMCKLGIGPTSSGADLAGTGATTECVHTAAQQVEAPSGYGCPDVPMKGTPGGAGGGGHGVFGGLMSGLLAGFGLRGGDSGSGGVGVSAGAGPGTAVAV